MEYLGYLFVFILAIEKVSADGKLSIKFVSYVNPGGNGANGHCCDGRSIFCTSDCDHMFELCVDYFYGDNNLNHCAIGKRNSDRIKNRDSITFTNTIANLPNPIVLSFTDWQNPGIKIKLRVMDYDSGNSHDFIEQIQKRVTISPAKYEREATEMRVSVASRTTLKVMLKVYCDANWYGKDCMVYCVPTNNTDGHYNCDQENGNKICHKGWEGTNCDHKINYCRSNPCQNNSTCLDGDNGYTCVCSLGNTGINCETDIDECSSSPCVYGVCYDRVNGFQCQCQQGYEGTLCNEKIDYCQDIQCENNGTCVSKLSGFNCLCVQKFTGLFCETLIISCLSNPCDNGSLCRETNHGHECELIPTTTIQVPSTTEIQLVSTISNYNNCSSGPCQNNGTCTETINGYNCTCLDGITGYDCNNITMAKYSPCQNITCHNNGTCILSAVDPYCNCTHEWEGKFCDTRKAKTEPKTRDACQNIKCQNNGTCKVITKTVNDTLHSQYNAKTDPDETTISPVSITTTYKELDDEMYFVCVCEQGYGGEFCELKNDTDSENDYDKHMKTLEEYPSALLFDGKLTDKDVSEILQKVKEILLSQHREYVGHMQVNYEIRTCLSEESTNVDIIVFNVKIKNHVIPWEKVDAAFSNYTFNSLDQFFPVPLYEGETCTPPENGHIDYQKVEIKKWISRYWYVIVVAAIILTIVILGTAFMVYRKRTRTAKVVIKEYPTLVTTQNEFETKETAENGTITGSTYNQVNEDNGNLNYFENKMFEYEEIPAADHEKS